MCVVTRDAGIEVLRSIVCVPITRTTRGIRSEVEVGADEGLPETSVINCDTALTILKSELDARPVGNLDVAKRAALDGALRYALDIRY